MNMTQLQEAVDLEMTLSLTPVCEDDHTDMYDARICECSTYAVARMHWTCTGKHLLVCQNVVDWIVAPPKSVCGEHPMKDCLKLTYL